MELLKPQKRCIWFTGLSGAGKSTLACELHNYLGKLGKPSVVLDGDVVRQGVNKDLGFSLSNRVENIRRTAEIEKLLLDAGILSICALISPTHFSRNLAKQIIGSDNFLEVYVNTPWEVCIERDVKGLYKKAELGLIKDLTGIDSPYECPLSPDLEINTQNYHINECVSMVYGKLVETQKICRIQKVKENL